MNLLKNRIFLGLALVAVIIICTLLYRSCTGNGLNVDPHAAREIEKAKQR